MPIEPSPERTNVNDGKRTALLNAARELFLKNTYSNISIRKISDKAKVNSAMIAYYFGSKSGLFREMVRSYASTQLNLLAESLEHANKMNLAEFLSNFYRTIPPELTQLIFRTLMFERSEMRDWLLNDMLKPALNHLEDMAAKVVTDNGKSVDPLVLRTTLQSMMLGPKLIQPVLQEINADRINDEFFDQLAEFNADLISSYFNLEVL